MDKPGLRYVGEDRWIPGIPARDLTAEEVDELGGEKELVKSGLYEKAGQTKAMDGPKENKSKSDGE